MKRQVHFFEGEKLAKKLNMRYWEVSAKNQLNIHEMIKSVAADTYHKLYCEHAKDEVDNEHIPEFYKQRAT